MEHKEREAPKSGQGGLVLHKEKAIVEAEKESVELSIWKMRLAATKTVQYSILGVNFVHRILTFFGSRSRHGGQDARAMEAEYQDMVEGAERLD